MVQLIAIVVGLALATLWIAGILFDFKGWVERHSATPHNREELRKYQDKSPVSSFP